MAYDSAAQETLKSLREDFAREAAVNRSVPRLLAFFIGADNDAENYTSYTSLVDKALVCFAKKETAGEGRTALSQLLNSYEYNENLSISRSSIVNPFGYAFPNPETIEQQAKKIENVVRKIQNVIKASF